MLRRIVEKAVIILLKKEVSQAAGLLILGCQAETTIHAMHDISRDHNMRCFINSY